MTSGEQKTTATPETPATPTPEKRLESLEDALSEMVDLLQDLNSRMEALEKNTVKKKSGLFGGKTKPRAIKDSKTGIVYTSLTALGKACAHEIGVDPLADKFVFYKLDKAFPDRFVEPTEAEATAAKAKQEEEAAKFRAEQDAKLAAEEAAKATTAAPAQAEKPAEKQAAPQNPKPDKK